VKFEVPKGATPIEDTEGLIAQVVLYRDLCAVEAENILKATSRHLSRRLNPSGEWLTEAFIRKIHSDMLGDVWSWAGVYRRMELNIGRVAPHRVTEEIVKLVEDFKYWKDMSVLERCVRLHHRLTWIHPFRNGNGRHARMVTDIYLYSQRHPLPIWPDNDLGKSGVTRKRYLDALKAADEENFAPLEQFIESLFPPKGPSAR